MADLLCFKYYKVVPGILAVDMRQLNHLSLDARKPVFGGLR